MIRLRSILTDITDRRRTRLAQERLARDVEQRRNSPTIVSYRKHREAALLGLQRKAVQQ